MPFDFPGLVLDASALLTLVLTDEEGDEVEELIQDIIRRNGQLLVPPPA
jgi:predicted nucleic acid-binding protein